MLKSNFKRLVSVMSAAAIFASLAAPAVLADDIEEAAEVTAVEEFEDVYEEPDMELAEAILSETAQLSANGYALLSNDFNDAAVGDVLVHQKEAQDAYTGFDGLSLYIGSGSTDNEDTKFSVASGVGTDGSNALVMSAGAVANGANGPRFTFDIPKANDYYTITFKAYLASESQRLFYNSSTSSQVGTIDMKLNAGEWNDIEIHVAKAGSSIGRVINVNGVTFQTDSSDATPVIWSRQTSNAGDVYIDDIVVTAGSALPTAIPTPSPEPIEKPQLGDKIDFNDYESGTVLFVQTTAQDPVEYKGFTLYIGNRGGGQSTNTYIGFAAQGPDSSMALVIANGQFYDAARGGRAKLIEPEGVTDYKVTFKAKATGTDDLSISSSTSSNDNSLVGLTPDKWSEVSILMTGGKRIVLLDGELSQYAVASELPTLWGKNANSVGNIYIDDIEYQELSAEDAVNAFAAIVDIENAEKTVYKNGSVYNFLSSFSVPELSVDKIINWSVGEVSGDEVVSTSDLKIQGSNVAAAAPDAEKTYVLTATVSDGELSASKSFELKYVPQENVVDEVIAALDMPTGSNKNRSDAIYKNTDDAPVTYNEVEYDAIYEVRKDFSLPLSEWVTAISWDSTDNSVIQIDKDGDVKVIPRSPDPIILTATVTYGTDTKTKSFYLDPSSYYTDLNVKVQNELTSSVLYPNGSIGESLAPVTLSKDGTATIPFDVTFKKISAADANLAISWSSSDSDVITNDGVIAVTDKDPHPVTLTKKVTYTMGGTTVVSDSVDYKVNVQFDPDKTDAANKAQAEAYAATINSDDSSAAYKTAYNTAMEILSDRYKTRGDANYAGNFSDVPDSVDDDFTLPTTGYFGSEITWGSSDTSIKISGKNAKVTQPSSDKNVQLKATFTSGASTAANAYTQTVTVEGTGKKSSSGSSSSGGGNSYRGTIGGSAYTAAATPTPVAPNAGVIDGTTVDIQSKFKDLLDVPWAAEAIEALADKGIVSGKDDTRFAPNDNITRAELSKIIVGAFGIETGAAADFSDVAADAWYAPYVGACSAAGIVTGYEDDTFKPDNLVTRQEMAVMIKRAADHKGIVIDTPNAKADFTDEAAIASYAAEAVETLQRAGMINGMDDGSFAPTATATRAQAAKILYNFCK